MTPSLPDDLRSLLLDGRESSPTVRGQIIFSEGRPPEFVYFLHSGLVKVCRGASASKEIVLGVAHPGELFGLKNAILDKKHWDRATVLVSGELTAIPRLDFLKLCDSKPELWRIIARMLSERQEELHRRVEMLVLASVEQRLLSCLVELAEFGPYAPEEGHSIPLSQGDLADIIGATRETTSNKLNRLAQRDLVVLGRRRVIVPRPAQLRTALNGSLRDNKRR
ncbi:MAG: Crp/Fnr family transcriptional regulator [Bryobacteraceae bacterium]|nr:Crp/Fnr family transcriptional regulator [Bryobacteraceae bacterium]